MVKNCKLIYFIVLFTLFSCGNVENSKIDFYTKKKEENDVWRIPIIYPYRLITADCCKDWGLIPRQVKPDQLSIYSIDSINYFDSCILFFSPDSYIDWGVIDLKNRVVLKFERKQMDSFCSTKLFERQLHDPEKVFQEWTKSGNLPWSEQIPKDQL